MHNTSPHPYAGCFIVFEGIDGSGKSTQARCLAETLTAQGRKVVLSKEPTEGQHGKRLRDSALAGRLPFDEELGLFLADRQEHLRTLVIPALQAGQTVILDRYFYSTLAYQGLRASELGLDRPPMDRLIRTNVPRPNITLWIRVPVERAVQRIVHRDGEVNHFERLESLIAVDRAFSQLAETEPGFVAIDGTGEVESVFAAVLSRVSDCH